MTIKPIYGSSGQIQISLTKWKTARDGMLDPDFDGTCLKG